ncbi:hypothetical protein [Flavobacterium sp. '19STA2R22 D10 B1']|uniref:hypothetical protein n=1 Tax=Flavobacterium aerium TaxID=3037261 RepID=UPI00278BC993|nr:hypothetical protein [Flavobacterium sp. '19STA2R22 D10 B1']
MSTAEIKNIIAENKDDIAFVIGNGVNRYPNNPNALSWDDLLLKLWDKASLHTVLKRPSGVSITEFYDILDLINNSSIQLQKEVATLMEDWEPLLHHETIVSRIKELNVPLLTTNFEATFAKTFEYDLYKIEQDRFTDYYPWNCYHANTELKSPLEGFGVWYINGMTHYHRSIRLGLSHYMGSVERARMLINSPMGKLYNAKNISDWKGNSTWLHIVFHRSLFIFGLGLDENETFLRWLLIERFKYYKKYPSRKHKGWYLYKRSDNPLDEGKKFFLQNVGFEIIEVDNYDTIYQGLWS